MLPDVREKRVAGLLGLHQYRDETPERLLKAVLLHLRQVEQDLDPIEQRVEPVREPRQTETGPVLAVAVAHTLHASPTVANRAQRLAEKLHLVTTLVPLEALDVPQGRRRQPEEGRDGLLDSRETLVDLGLQSDARDVMRETTDGGRVLRVDPPDRVRADRQLRHEVTPRVRPDVPDPFVIVRGVEQ